MADKFIKKIKILVNACFFNPYYNLAFEEYLFKKELGDGDLYLFLWQNDRTVVVGKNQNPFSECNMDVIRKNHIHIARRMTGGGAVYHDKGNLNYSIIANNSTFSKEKNQQYIINALNAVLPENVMAQTSGRNDIEIDGKKVSGTAYRIGDHNSLQHGCILVDTDLNILENVLLVKEDKISTKGIKSVRSRVVRLRDIDKDINVSTVSTAFIDAFTNKTYSRFFEERSVDLNSFDEKEYVTLVKKYTSNQWIFTDRIPASYKIYNRFSWGRCELNFVTDGILISNVRIFSDSLETDIFEEKLLGLQLSVKSIKDQLEKIENEYTKAKETEILEDIKSMLENKLNGEGIA